MKRIIKLPGKFILLLLFLLLFSRCEKFEDLAEQVEFLDGMYFGICFVGTPSGLSKEEIIRDYESYQNYFNQKRIHPYNSDCDTAELPNIDFDKYSLIGKYTEGGGCDVVYDREVIENKLKNKIIYKISVEYIEGCLMLITNMNWALIPKLKRNYDVEFIVEYVE